MQPTETRFQGVKRLLRYLKGTLQLSLHVKPMQHMRLVAFTDADWATYLDDQRSVEGVCVYLGDNLVSWSLRKKRAISRSSVESEYRALANGASEIKWLNSLLTELGLRLKQPSMIWCDNLSAKALASNPVQHARSKNIEIDIHFIRDMILKREVDVHYVRSKFQVADYLTKALMQGQFEKNKSKLRLCYAPSSRMLRHNQFLCNYLHFC